MIYQENNSNQNIYVILNPVAGNSKPDELREAIEELCVRQGWIHDIYKTTGKENVAELTREACKNGATMVVAAGGDGTVSGVVNGLKGMQVPLGIIPVGTGNGLARAMRIPLDPEAAIQLLFGEHAVRKIDAMQVGEQYFVLNVSAGISSRTMQQTDPEEKQRLGILAYAQKMIKDVVQNEPILFNLVIDGHGVQVEASEVLVSNAELLKEPPYLFGAAEGFSDGLFELNILTANTATDYIRLVWDLLSDPKESKSELRDLSVRKGISIDVVGEPQPVQGDGEVIGQTPVEVKMVTEAIRVIVPTPEQVENSGVPSLI